MVCFITGEDVVESLYGYAWDDKHDGKHEHWHDELYPHGNKHTGKHDKDGEPNYQIIGTKRTFEYDDDGKLLTATEKEDRQIDAYNSGTMTAAQEAMLKAGNWLAP